METCIGCKHNIGNLNSVGTYLAREIPDECWGCYTWYRDTLTARKHYEPDGKTCVGCTFNKVGVVYMSVTAYNLSYLGCPCFFCYDWYQRNSKRLEYEPAMAKEYDTEGRWF